MMKTCGFVLAWVGPCNNEMPCTKHQDMKCSCGAPATRECDETMGPMVCGSPLCGNCEHAIYRSGCNAPIHDDPNDVPRHIPKGTQKYKPWYAQQNEAQRLLQEIDSISGIRQAIQTLQGFHDLHRKRLAYFREIGKRLNEFIVRGFWLLDSCGNVLAASEQEGEKSLKELVPRIPDVVSKEDVWTTYLSKDTWLSWSHKAKLPPVGILCAGCSRPWSIDNCETAHVVDTPSDRVSLAPSIGLPLRKAVEREKARLDKEALFFPDRALRNDKYIDLSVNDHGWKKNEHGWVDADLDHIVEPGDEALFQYRVYMHLACHRERQEKGLQEQFSNIFFEADIPIRMLHAVENRYCKCVHCGPWFKADTKKGWITIGWRKRVINIDWSQTSFPKAPPKSLDQEEVTKGEGYIHAWSPEKASEYLRALFA